MFQRGNKNLHINSNEQKKLSSCGTVLFSMVNLEEVILGQCAWKAPKKARPPKETE